MQNEDYHPMNYKNQLYSHSSPEQPERDYIPFGRNKWNPHARVVTVFDSARTDYRIGQYYYSDHVDASWSDPDHQISEDQFHPFFPETYNGLTQHVWGVMYEISQIRPFVVENDIVKYGEPIGKVRHYHVVVEYI